jgi:hypothetical protein
MKQFKTILITLIILSFASCSPDKSVYFETILKSDKNHLRGVNISSDITTVKASENSEFLLDDMEEYLHYDYELDMGNSYTVTYDFSENSLYAIEMSAYLDKTEDAKVLFTDFSTFFDGKYKKGKLEEDGYTTWYTTLAKTNDDIEFAMKEDSENYGFLSIKIRNLDY